MEYRCAIIVHYYYDDPIPEVMLGFVSGDPKRRRLVMDGGRPEFPFRVDIGPDGGLMVFREPLIINRIGPSSRANFVSVPPEVKWHVEQYTPTGELEKIITKEDYIAAVV